MDKKHLESMVSNSVHHQACTCLGHSISMQPALGQANDCALDALANRGVGGLGPRSCLRGLSKTYRGRACKADHRHHGFRAFLKRRPQDIEKEMLGPHGLGCGGLQIDP